jgi:hypothetical protein
MLSRLLSISMLLLGSSSCSLPTQADDPALVTNLRFSPSAFDSFKRNTEIRYSLKYPAQVSIVIVRREGGADELIKTLFMDLEESKGTQAHTWLGDTEQGMFARTGVYYGVLRAGGRRVEAEVRIYHE